MSMSAGSPLVAQHFNLGAVSAPILIRASGVPVLVAAAIAFNAGAAYVYLQLLISTSPSSAPGAGAVPVLTIPAPAGSTLIIDSALMEGGVRAENMWLAISSTGHIYTAAVTTGYLELFVN